jgi:hypothetical protein
MMRKRAFGNTYKILVEKPEGKRPLGRPRRRYEDNITVDVSDVEGSSLERGARSG